MAGRPWGELRLEAEKGVLPTSVSRQHQPKTIIHTNCGEIVIIPRKVANL